MNLFISLVHVIRARFVVSVVGASPTASASCSTSTDIGVAVDERDVDGFSKECGDKLGDRNKLWVDEMDDDGEDDVVFTLIAAVQDWASCSDSVPSPEYVGLPELACSGRDSPFLVLTWCTLLLLLNRIAIVGLLLLRWSLVSIQLTAANVRPSRGCRWSSWTWS